nr:hypothetical protein [Tanacetum cinerariifolium]
SFTATATKRMPDASCISMALRSIHFLKFILVQR